MDTKNINIKEYSFILLNNAYNKALLFIQYPYLFKNNLVGKCIYLQNPDSNYLNIRKKILDENYYLVKEFREGDKLVINPDSNMNRELQIAMPDCIDSTYKQDLFSTNLSFIKDSCLVEVFDPITIKEKIIRNDIIFENIILEISKEFSLSINQIGFTGSILFCDLQTVNDIDVVLYVNPEKAKEIKQIVAKKRRIVLVESLFGIDWPLRYYDSKKNLICLFLSYKNPDISPLLNYKNFKFLKNIEFDTYVNNDVHSEFAPTIVGLDNPKCFLIILGTVCRGFFKNGDRIKGEGILIQGNSTSNNELFIIVSNPWKQLSIEPFNI